MSALPASTLAAARTLLEDVMDPELGADIVALGMVGVLRGEGSTLVVPVGLTTAACPLRAQLRDDVVHRLERLAGVEQVKLEFFELAPEDRRAVMTRARAAAQERGATQSLAPTVRTLAVASGKGGVGKTTTTVNLAVALAQRGHSVGLIDADIAGHSAALQLGITERITARATPKGPRMVPVEVPFGDGVLKVVSTGLIVETPDAALVWRGLMLGRAVEHFVEDVDWGQLDYLLIDLPPGTSDVALKVATLIPTLDVVVVTTPEPTAATVAARAVDLARRYHLRVAGVVENMTGVVCPHGSLVPIFGVPGAGAALAAASGVPLAAAVPLAPAGTTSPVVLAAPHSAAAGAFVELARRVVEELAPPLDRGSCTSRLLTSLERAAREAPAAS